MESSAVRSSWGLSNFSLEKGGIDPKKTALLIIDMIYMDAHPDYGLGKRVKEAGEWVSWEYYFNQVTKIIPKIRTLIEASRSAGIEVIYTTVQELTEDCRDASRLHKLSNFMVPRGSEEAQVLRELMPLPNEIVISKTCSGVFNGSQIDQILRNLDVSKLLVTGVVTNYCVETTVRDAGDKGYEVVLVEDGCAALSEVHQKLALEVLRDSYCTVVTTADILKEIHSVGMTARS